MVSFGMIVANEQVRDLYRSATTATADRQTDLPVELSLIIRSNGLILQRHSGES